jgi:acetyl/propionyl-CoA carboxylase alpha subunit
MFKKVLIANRGEIAVRIIRTCQEMGIRTVALYQPPDRESMHVRLADECAALDTAGGFLDQDYVLDVAQKREADAIHPGIGFLTERDEFIARCDDAQIKFIGPPAETVRLLRDKIEIVERARMAGFPTVPHSECVYDETQLESVHREAARLGYPVIVKSCRGGRGRGARLVRSAERLNAAVRWSQTEAQTIYGDRRVYLEKAVHPAHQVGVQILCDERGRKVHLGEREGSLLYGNQKVVEEAPAPCLPNDLRLKIWQTALDIASLFEFQNVGTVEFLVDENGNYFFTEIKPRIQIEHPLTEMLTRIDLIREQIRLAAGEQLEFEQDDVKIDGWAMQCRINAEDPWNQYMPSPGFLRNLRFPGGSDVRVDTYLFNGCVVPIEYDPLIAKLLVWGNDREACRQRLGRALDETQFSGISTNLSLVRRIVEQPDFAAGRYSTDFSPAEIPEDTADKDLLRDLAVAAAIAYIRQRQAFRPELPERLLNGWHRDSRRLPS